MTNRAPLIVAIVLLLLPVLYVGSYLALVVPAGIYREEPEPYFGPTYHGGGSFSKWLYWPLAQIDQKLRPQAWVPAIQD